MPQTLLNQTDVLIKNETAALAHFPYHAAAIARYRASLFSQLEKIDAFTGTPAADETVYLPLWKKGTALAAMIVKTRIHEIHGDDYLITAPDIVPEEMRTKCITLYDRFKDSIRTHDRLFIADLIERTAPDPARRIRLMQDHDEEVFHVKISRQASNSSINKLFGSSIRQ